MRTSREMMIFLIAINMLAGTCFVLAASEKTASYSREQQEYSFIDSNAVFVVNDKGDIKKAFYQEKKEVLKQELSNDAEKLALKISNQEKKYVFHGIAEYNQEELVIKNISADSILFEMKIDQLVDLCWSPDGTKLVFIKGVFERSKFAKLFVEGHEVYIYDTTKGELLKLLDGGEDKFYMDVKWLPSDGRLYVTTGINKKDQTFIAAHYYDFNKGILIPTRAKTANLSPNGKYYFDAFGETQLGSFGDATTGLPIHYKLGEKFKSSGPFGFLDQNTTLFDWFEINDDTFALVINGGILYKFNCQTGEVIGIDFPGQDLSEIKPVGIKNGSIVFLRMNTPEKAELLFRSVP